MLQKGGWSFYCSAVFRGLSWLKISNTGTAWTSRIYIMVVYSLKYEYIRENGVFCRFCALCALLPDGVDIISARQKYSLKTVVSVSDMATLLFYSFARFFCFSSLCLAFLFFRSSSFCCCFLLSFVFLSFVCCYFLLLPFTCLLAYLLTCL